MRAVCLVDLNAIRHNVSVLAGRAAPAALCAMVKADGYGHGIVPSARAALSAGATWVGVMCVEEALVLRAAGIDAPVVALLVPPNADLVGAVTQRIDLGVGGLAVLARVTDAAQAVGRPARVHLEIDTGMGRGGCTASDWADLVTSASRARTCGLIDIVGIWSHLARAEDPGHPVTAAQLTAFRAALDGAAHLGVKPELRHLANSAALFTEPTSRYDLVRAGIAVYGISPGAAVGSAQDLGLRPAMTLMSEVALTKRVPANHGVSYGHRYHTAAETTLALVSIGFADGVPRTAGNIAEVLIGGRRRRVAGTMCMDQFVVDVGDDPVEIGDDVVLFGPGDRGEPTAPEWAARLDTIPEEILTRIGPRVPRVYIG